MTYRNTSAPSGYAITIAAGGGGVPTEGFIDSQTAEFYLANATATGNSPVYPAYETSLDNLPGSFTLATSFAKKRANMRYNAMVAQLGLISNIYINKVVATGATASTAASSFAFDAVVEHGDGSLQTWDETAPGVLLSDPVTVLTRAIARALSRDLVMTVELLDPTASASVGVMGAGTALPRFGVRTTVLEVGPAFASLTAAAAAITVVQMF